MDVVPQSRIDLFAEMESHYEKQDTQYFVKLLDHDDYVVRCRATCILVDLGGEDKVQYVAKVLKDDPNELVRHEAAWTIYLKYFYKFYIVSFFVKVCFHSLNPFS